MFNDDKKKKINDRGKFEWRNCIRVDFTRCDPRT